MKIIEAVRLLSNVDRTLSRYVFSKNDLRVMFSGESNASLNKTIERLLSATLLESVSKGVYLYSDATSKSGYVIEDIANVIRQGYLQYVSLESALSEYGRISQIPVDHITIMTTGRSGTYTTSYGVIEFTHTKRREIDLSDRIVRIKGRPLAVATEEAAFEDLKKVGRNLNMVGEHE